MFTIRRSFLAAPSRAYRCAPLPRSIAAKRLYSTPAQADQPAAVDNNADEAPSETPDKAADTPAVETTKEPAAEPAKPPPAAKSSERVIKYANDSAAKPSSKPAAAATKPAAKTNGPVTHFPPQYVINPTDPSWKPFPAPRDSDVDWSTSYHGISMQAVHGNQLKLLMKPILDVDIEVKPDGILYLPEIKYRRRLNESFGPAGWGMIPRGEPVVGENIVTREYALIVGGRFVSQAQGENTYFSAEQLPAAVEGCKSNALMRCCKDLGIASELWDPRFVRAFRRTKLEEVWVVHGTTKKKRIMWFKKGEVDIPYPWKKA